MEQDISVNNICRCCMAEGTYKGLKTKYTWMGVEEIYADMLKQCFDITVSFESITLRYIMYKANKLRKIVIT